MLLPVAGPSITEKEIRYATEAAKTAWFENHAEFNNRFEALFAKTIGVKHAVSLPHCTAAIHLALAAKGIGAGDEVIVPDVTWIASIAPLDYVGATPVFVDIRSDTWCIDTSAIEAAVTERTKAIIGVNLYGSMCDWNLLRKLAKKYDLFLLEDAAEAVGSTFEGIQAGGLGNVGAFSFHGSKTITTGEGGMLVTDDDALHARVLKLRDHGRPPGDKLFLNDEVAFKYKMSALQAALGLAQIERFDELIAMKRQIFAWYQEALEGIPGLTMNIEPEATQNSFWMVTIVPDERYEIDKFGIMEGLKKQSIDSRPFFSRLSTLPPYRKRAESLRFLPEKTAGDAISRRGVNLPSGYHVQQSDVAKVRGALLKVLGI